MLILEYSFFRERRKFPSTTTIRNCFKNLLKETDEGMEISFHKMCLKKEKHKLYREKDRPTQYMYVSLNDINSPSQTEEARSWWVDVNLDHYSEDKEWIFDVTNTYDYIYIKTSLGINASGSSATDIKLDYLIDGLEGMKKQFPEWKQIHSLWAEDIGNNIEEHLYEGWYFNVDSTDFFKLKNGKFFKKGEKTYLLE